jgi:hypothetical protein
LIATSDDFPGNGKLLRKRRGSFLIIGSRRGWQLALREDLLYQCGEFEVLISFAANSL